ncbi:MAG TPA: carboxylesterase family protein [bacterium]|nr:carboxylesterase family protein [bacterium]
MKKVRAIFIICCAVILIGAGRAGTEDVCTEPVRTGAGMVRGAAETGTETCVWKGIPFAAPPVGELRWKAPEPPAPWSGVRDALAFSDRCLQKGVMALEGLAGKEGMSEDCLYLNVWRPRKSGTFPVMVWIHGGGYVGGAAFTPMYWGDRLAQAGDVVVVTTNYRLNVFGFLALAALRAEDKNGSVGSYGSLDQVAALQWVHANIAAFGGDPENVTIFGESAGGFSICTMIATPLAKGLFQRAILESGGCDVSADLEPGYAQGDSIAANLGCRPDDLACLRRLSAKQVEDKGASGLTSGMGFMPHHDGWLLTATSLAMIRAGDYNRVSFMAGSNRDEFGKAMKLKRDLKNAKPSDYEKTLIDVIGIAPEDAAKLTALYPLGDYGNRPVEAYGRMLGADASLACPTYEGLLAAARQQQDTYYYRFDYDDFRFGKYMGAAHAMEIPFIFDSFDRLPMSLFYNDQNIAPARALGRVIRGYWLNFAKTGDPNGQGLPQWPAFNPDTRMVQVFDATVRTEPAPNVARCAFWDEYTKTHKGSLESLGTRKKERK